MKNLIIFILLVFVASCGKGKKSGGFNPATTYFSTLFDNLNCPDCLILEINKRVLNFTYNDTMVTNCRGRGSFRSQIGEEFDLPTSYMQQYSYRVQSIQSDYLDNRCFPQEGEQVIFENAFSTTTASIRVQGVDGTTIASGSQLRDDQGRMYLTTETRIIGESTSGDVDVLIESQARGSESNISNGEALTFTSPIVGTTGNPTVISTTKAGESLYIFTVPRGDFEPGLISIKKR